MDRELARCWPECVPADPCAVPDRDGDGHLAVACGGDDCDDREAAVHPGVLEAFAGSAVCGDGLDNDCDGLVDAAEPRCGPATCSQDGWCQALDPAASWGSLNSVWALSPTQVWVGGWDSLLLRYDGTRWSGQLLDDLPGGLGYVGEMWGTGHALWAARSSYKELLRLQADRWELVPLQAQDLVTDLWGTAPDDLWLVGRYTFQHWDGRTWTTERGEAGASGHEIWSQSVWSFAPDDTWAVAKDPGSDNLVLWRWDGQTWARTDWLAPANGRIFGFGPDDVWLAGRGGTVLHYDGQAWSAVESGTSQAINALWGPRADDLWLVTQEGQAVHWDGHAMVVRETGATYFAAVHGTAGDDVWAVGDGIAHWNGATWTAVHQPTPAQLYQDLWASSATDVWVSTVNQPELLHWDGEAWRAVPHPAGSVADLWGFGPGEVWLADGVAVWRRAAEGWVQLPDPSPISMIEAMWGSAPDDLWIAGITGTARWDGQRWNTYVEYDLPSYLALWGFGPDDVWGAGRGLVSHWDGSAWQRQDPGIEEHIILRAMWGSGPDDLWITGDRTLRWDGKAWEVRLETMRNGISGRGADDIWAVGDFGALWHWDGRNWTRQQSGTHLDLEDVWASPDGGVWACGWDALLSLRR